MNTSVSGAIMPESCGHSLCSSCGIASSLTCPMAYRLTSNWTKLRLRGWPKLNPTVLHIIDSFEQGGTERQALQLVRMLHSDGHYRVRLACLQRHGLLLNDAETLNLGPIPEYPLTSFYDLNFVQQLRRLVRFLKENEIKI